MSLLRILHDPNSHLSWGYFSGGKMSLGGVITWLSTTANQAELKRLFPNTSIRLLSLESKDFQYLVQDLLAKTTFEVTESYTLLTFSQRYWNGHSNFYLLDRGQVSGLENIPLSHKFFELYPRIRPYTPDLHREHQLNKILLGE